MPHNPENSFVLKRAVDLLNDEHIKIEAVLELLRNNGFSKIQSIKVLVDTGQYGLADAKIIVHESSVWKDTVLEHADLHDKLFENL